MKDRPRRFGVAALDEYRKLVTSFLSRDRGERFETFVNSTNEHAQVVIEEFVKFAKKEILIAANEASADQFDTPGVLKRLADFVTRVGVRSGPSKIARKASFDRCSRRLGATGTRAPRLEGLRTRGRTTATNGRECRALRE